MDEQILIVCEACGSVAHGEYRNECDCTKMETGTQRLVLLRRSAALDELGKLDGELMWPKEAE